MKRRKVLIVIQDEQNDNHSLATIAEDMVQCAECLLGLDDYGIDKAIVVVNRHLEMAEQQISEEYKDKIILMEDLNYEQYGDNGSLYIGFEHVEKGDVVVIMRPSKCFGYNEDSGLGIIAENLEFISYEKVEQFEQDLENSLK